MSDDNVHYPDWPVKAGQVGGRGGGPHFPDMEPRVQALEADMKDVKAGIGRIETTLARIDERTQQAATKSDIATLGGRVGEIDARLKTAEGSISTALTTAIGKAIGPLQLMGILTGSVTLFGVALAVYRWLVHQPWFAG